MLGLGFIPVSFSWEVTTSGCVMLETQAGGKQCRIIKLIILHKTQFFHYLWIQRWSSRKTFSLPTKGVLEMTIIAGRIKLYLFNYYANTCISGVWMQPWGQKEGKRGGSLSVWHWACTMLGDSMRGHTSPYLIYMLNLICWLKRFSCC